MTTRKIGQAKKAAPKANQNRVEGTEARPRQRTPVSGTRDILTVVGKNPEFYYRFIEDKDDGGARIWKFKQAGYEFVNYDEVSGIGQDAVYNVENIGSVVAVPNGSGNFMFLMKLPMEYYEEDKAAKAAAIDESEASMKRKRSSGADDGQYGEVKLSF